MPLSHARLVSALAAAAMLPCARAANVQWRLDARHSQVQFGVDHQGYSTTFGHLRIKDGRLDFDPRDWSSARLEVEIDMTSVSLGDAQLDAAVRAAALLDTARWPSARFTSRRVESHDGRHGVVHGQLQWRGHTRPLELAVTLNRLAPDPYSMRRKIGFSATATLARQEFGITRYPDAIGTDVALRIEVEGIRATGAPPLETTDGTQE